MRDRDHADFDADLLALRTWATAPEMFRQLVDQLPNPLYLLAAQRRDGVAEELYVVFANAAAVGDDDAELLLDRPVREVAAELADHEVFERCLAALNLDVTPQSIALPDDRQATIAPLGTDLVVLQTHDVTASVDLARQLATPYVNGFDASPVAAAIIDEAGRIVAANRRLLELTDGQASPAPHRAKPATGADNPSPDGSGPGADPADSRRTTITDLLPDHGLDDLIRQLPTLFSGATPTISVTPLDASPTSDSPLHTSLALIPDVEPPLALLQMVDISAVKALEAEVSHLTLHDHLTGLPNRALATDRLDQAIGRLGHDGRYVGVFSVDIDYFKVINDGLGHETGDAALRAIANRLRNLFTEQHTVGRLGGDEFVVIAIDLSHPGEAATIAEKIQTAFRDPITVDDQEFSVTVSIGFTTTSDSTLRAQALIRDADVAMYRAKDTGRNRSEAFSHTLRSRAVQRVNTDQALRRALSEDEMIVHYQPVVASDTGLITGVEALVRWIHPTKGMVPPIEFISIAEETGLIIQLGQWVLQEACSQVQAWRSSLGVVDLRVAVNLSARQIAHPGLVDTVQTVLARTELPPESLTLELTESVMMADASNARLVLEQIKSLGVELSIDDFGTGYSSLAYLKGFPVDVLKIDRSFVTRIATDSEDRAIVAAIMAVANALGLSTVAEGVEDPDQLAELTSLGCPHVQGYYFSKPLPAAELVGLLLQQRAEQRRDDATASALGTPIS